MRNPTTTTTMNLLCRQEIKEGTTERFSTASGRVFLSMLLNLSMSQFLTCMMWIILQPFPKLVMKVQLYKISEQCPGSKEHHKCWWRLLFRLHHTSHRDLVSFIFRSLFIYAFSHPGLIFHSFLPITYITSLNSPQKA